MPVDPGNDPRRPWRSRRRSRTRPKRSSRPGRSPILKCSTRPSDATPPRSPAVARWRQAHSPRAPRRVAERTVEVSPRRLGCAARRYPRRARTRGRLSGGRAGGADTHPVARCSRDGRGGAFCRRSRCLRRHGDASRRGPRAAPFRKASPSPSARTRPSTARSVPRRYIARARRCSPRPHERTPRDARSSPSSSPTWSASRSRAESLDPEDVRRSSGRTTSGCARARALRRHGGEVHRRRGHGPLRRPDRARGRPRARRARRARHPRLGRPGGRARGPHRRHHRRGARLARRAARRRGRAWPRGDVVNTAARLQAAAPANGILVDETTYRATERAIPFAEAGRSRRRARASRSSLWLALEASARFGVDVTSDGETPLVGRDRELDLLRRRARARRSTSASRSS